jgi:hypothetical protein
MLSYTIEGFPPAVTRVQNTWLLRPVEPITTSVSLITDIETTSSLRGRVIGKVVARQLDRASLAMLDGLAASVEEAS